MKTLKEYIRDCSVSTTLSEASLLDIEDTLNSGNKLVKDIEKEFNIMKTGMCNPLMWVKDSRGGIQEWRYGYNVGNLCNFMGYKGYDYVTTCIYKSKKRDEWNFTMFFQSKNRKSLDTLMTTKFWRPMTTFKTFKQFIKSEIEPIFKDIDTLKVYIEENKKMR